MGPIAVGWLLAPVLILAMAAGACGGRRRRQEVVKRGATLIGAAKSPVRRAAAQRIKSGQLALAGVHIPLLDETKHFKMIGTTGTGKSTAIRELLGAALRRGDRALFADPDGGYCRHFFDRYRGDVLLNPFERNSVKWSPFLEIEQPYDVEELAAGLIPSTGDNSSNEWRAYARTFLGAVLRRCMAARRYDCGELWRLMAVATHDELRSLVVDTPAQPFLEPENARMFASIRSVAISAMAAVEYIQGQRSAPFSVRRWVRVAGGGSLFIPYKAGQIAALRSMIATWVRIAIFEAMSMREDRDQRLWFVIDELDALGAIEGLKDALARLRKFGGRCVLGFQSVAQVSGTYGVAAAQTIVENCGNTLIFRCAGSENGGTSQFASKLIGEREVIRRQMTRGSDRDGRFFAQGTRRSKNISEQQVTEPAVMASQIEQLPDLCGYFRSASVPAWRIVSFRY